MYYEEIKSRLTMKDVVTRYAQMPNRGGFICCPFHIEKTPSMKISNDGYYCFGCHEHGNIFGFVMKMFNIDFRQACDKLNFDFGLNIPTTTKLTRQDKIAMLESKKKHEAEKNRVKVLEEYREKCLWELDARQEKIWDKMEEIKPMLYSNGIFLFNLTEDMDFENLCVEFLGLKKNYDIIDFNIVVYKNADIEKLESLYRLSSGKLHIQKIF